MDYIGLAALIASIAAAAATIIGSVAAAYVSVMSHLKDVKLNVQKIETATNSMKDALVLATRQAALGEGEAKGRADLKAETNEEAATRRPSVPRFPPPHLGSQP